MTWIAFIASPLGRKVVLYTGISLALFFLYRWHTNKIYNQGFDKGRVNGIEQLTKAKEAEWKAKEKDLEAHKQEIVASARGLEKEQREAGRLRVQIKSDLDRGINKLQDTLKKSADEVAVIPASELDSKIRSELGALRK